MVFDALAPISRILSNPTALQDLAAELGDGETAIYLGRLLPAVSSARPNLRLHREGFATNARHRAPSREALADTTTLFTFASGDKNRDVLPPISDISPLISTRCIVSVVLSLSLMDS